MSAEVRRVCVYCGSRPGARPAYARAARRLGERLAAEGVGLVTGGGRVGLMGVVADAVLAGGGRAVGVIPQALAGREVGHGGMTGLHVVGSMHERKAMMADLADAFVALPGGLGTLEEIAEALTWAGLGIHAKPCALLDVGGYYGPLVAWLDHAVAEGFVSAEARAALVVEADPDALLDRLLGPAASGGLRAARGDAGAASGSVRTAGGGGRADAEAASGAAVAGTEAASGNTEAASARAAGRGPGATSGGAERAGPDAASSGTPSPPGAEVASGGPTRRDLGAASGGPRDPRGGSPAASGGAEC